MEVLLGSGELGGDGFGERQRDAEPGTKGRGVDRCSRPGPVFVGDLAGVGDEGGRNGSCRRRSGFEFRGRQFGRRRLRLGYVVRAVPPRKATAGHPATRMRNQAGTASRSSSLAVAMLAPSDVVSATRNQHQPAAFEPPERSRRQAATNNRSTETG